MRAKIKKSKGAAEIATLSLPGRTEHSITVNGDDCQGMEKSMVEASRDLQALPREHFVFNGTKMDAGAKSDGIYARLRGDACRMEAPQSMQTLAMSGCETIPVRLGGKTVGFTYEDEHARYCRLCGVTPNNTRASRAAQAAEIFEIMNAALETASFEFADTIRTWFYLDRLLEWYKEFNQARTAFFEKAGVFDKMVPASTGIGAANHAGAALLCSLIAVRPKSGKVGITSVDSPMQGSALSYKSSFSRAVEIDCPTHRSLLISGTASIAPDGKTVNLGDTAAQIDLTMRVVGTLLKSRGMGWEDAFRGIAYFRDLADKKLYDQYCNRNNIPAFPTAMAWTDICRDDLLFELELDAVQSV